MRFHGRLRISKKSIFFSTEAFTDAFTEALVEVNLLAQKLSVNAFVELNNNEK